MEKKEVRLRITNRQIAKLLSRLEELQLNLPQILLDEIKRYMWYLSEDLEALYTEKEVKEKVRRELWQKDL